MFCCSWTNEITTNGGSCREGSVPSTSGAGGNFAACCSPWSGATANINEWMSLECSIEKTHAADAWVTIATFGPHGIDSYEALHAAGWIMHDTDDYQICGLGNSCAGWCPDQDDCQGYCDETYSCSHTDEYAAFVSGHTFSLCGAFSVESPTCR